MDDSKTERGGFVKGSVPLARARALAESLQNQLLGIAERASITGSVLRRKPVVGDVDLLILPKDIPRALAALEADGFRGDFRIMRKMISGILVEIYIAHRENELGALKLYTTGDIVFMRDMREKAREFGLELTQYGLYERDSQKVFMESPYERDYFEVLDVPWLPPEKRNFEAKGRPMMGDRYVPPDEFEKLMRKTASSLPPKEWSPFWKKMKTPQKMFKGVEWDLKPWRSPDLQDEGKMVWYGPAGREGDEAAAIMYQDGGWAFGQYTGVVGLIDNPPGPILSTWTFLSFDELRDAILEKAMTEMRSGVFERHPDTWARWAASVASVKLAYSGGSEEFVETLP